MSNIYLDQNDLVIFDPVTNQIHFGFTSVSTYGFKTDSTDTFEGAGNSLTSLTNYGDIPAGWI